MKFYSSYIIFSLVISFNVSLRAQDIITGENDADVYIMKGDYKSAIKELNKGIAADSLNTKFYELRSSCYDKIGNTDEAINDYGVLIRRQQLSIKRWHHLGMLYTTIGEYLKANICFAQIITLDPANSDAYLNLAFSKREAGDKKGSDADLSKAMSLNTNYSDPLIIEGIDLFLSDDKKGACEKWNEVNSVAKTEAQKLIKTFCNRKKE